MADAPINFTQLSNHRSNIAGWEYMKTLIWGNHKWDFCKIVYPQNGDPIKILTPYFTKNNIPISKTKQKEIKDLCKNLTKRTWFPLDRLYIKAKYVNTVTKETKNLDLSKKEHREYFLEKSKIHPSEFFNWVLYIMDWENLKTLDDILMNWPSLSDKFFHFISSDLNPEELTEEFNKRLSELEEHTIEPILRLNPEMYYRFITHPRVVECSTKNALDKLFFLISNSEFLKGVGTFQKWRPSFDRFVEKLDEIFSGKYGKNNQDSSRFRRLKEREIRLYDSDENKSYIDNNNFIPTSIKKKYAFQGWEINEIEPELITTQEMIKYTKMIRASSNRIQMLAGELRKKIAERNNNKEDFELIKAVTHRPKPPKEPMPEKTKEELEKELIEMFDRKKAEKETPKEV